MKHIIKVEVLENLPSTRPLIAMDAEGNLVCKQKQDGTKIWYTTADDEIYDLNGFIEMMAATAGGTYNGPAIVSNEYDEEKQMWCMTFDDTVTVLGDFNPETITLEGPVFSTNSEYGLVCNVETIILPETITRIGDYAFTYCETLTSVTIPNSVKSIGSGAFYMCSGLASVTCEAPTPPALDRLSVFDYTNNCPIYVPIGSVDTYKAAPNWSEYADRIVGLGLLLNNQIKYTANHKLTINDVVDYTEHTFANGVGLVTFNNDLEALKSGWFIDTFYDFADNMTSLTLPNGVSDIGMSALPDYGDVYYEGSQKECARIYKDIYDGIGTRSLICFDGIVNSFYMSNIINSIQLWAVGTESWLSDLIGRKTLDSLVMIISSISIDEDPMTAGEFITMLVNGTQDIPALSTYGFIDVNQEVQGVTIPLAYHTGSGHFIGIVKASNYAYVDLEHIALVAVNESLNSDYMYMLLDDTSTTDS